MYGSVLYRSVLYRSVEYTLDYGRGHLLLRSFDICFTNVNYIRKVEVSKHVTASDYDSVIVRFLSYNKKEEEEEDRDNHYLTDLK